MNRFSIDGGDNVASHQPSFVGRRARRLYIIKGSAGIVVRRIERIYSRFSARPARAKLNINTLSNGSDDRSEARRGDKKYQQANKHPAHSAHPPLPLTHLAA